MRSQRVHYQIGYPEIKAHFDDLSGRGCEENESRRYGNEKIRRR